MATAADTGGTASSAQTSAYAQFATAVAHGTGLALPVVQAWVLAEGGPIDNPLNIGPGRSYGSWQNAAAATVSLLHTKTYSNVAAAARQGDQKTQLTAIVNSPWDAGHYTDQKPGDKLLGAFSRVESGGGDVLGSIGGAIAGGASAVYNAGNQSLLDALGIDPGSWVGQLAKYVEAKSVTALSYVGLTLLALALIVLGSLRATGTSPRSLIPTPSDIPF